MKKIRWIIIVPIVALLILLVVVYIFAKLPPQPHVADCPTPGSEEFQYYRPMDSRCIVGSYSVEEVMELKKSLRGKVMEVIGDKSNSTRDTFATYLPTLVGTTGKIYLPYSVNEYIDMDYDGLIGCIGVYRYNFILRTHHLDPASCKIGTDHGDGLTSEDLEMMEALPALGEFDPYNIVLPNGEPLRRFMLEHDPEFYEKWGMEDE